MRALPACPCGFLGMALLALIGVTAIWGVTFVQVKDAVAVYPLFAFLAVRYAIAAGVLGIAWAARVRSLGRQGRSTEENLLVLVSTPAQALQIVRVGRYPRRFDAIALTLVAMATSCAG